MYIFDFSLVIGKDHGKVNERFFDKSLGGSIAITLKLLLCSSLRLQLIPCNGLFAGMAKITQFFLEP